MRKLYIILSLLGSFAFSQEYEDVIYLKNGSEIHGMIIEQAPGQYIKIQSGKNVFVYQLNEIEKITKEQISVIDESLLENKLWSANIGWGSPRSLNLIGITKDFRWVKNHIFFITGGLGTALIGIGYAYEPNYNKNGISFSATLGFNAAGGTFNTSFVRQWKTGKSGFIALGIMGGIFGYYERKYSLYFDAYRDYYRSAPYLSPVLSYDIRF